MYFFPFHFSNIFCHKLFNQFHLFSKEMEKRGHNRSWSQCRIKTKALRSMYTKVNPLRTGDALRHSLAGAG